MLLSTKQVSKPCYNGYVNALFFLRSLRKCEAYNSERGKKENLVAMLFKIKARNKLSELHGKQKKSLLLQFTNTWPIATTVTSAIN